MPKTKNAFALRDFDAEKILSRRYFKDFGLPEMTDEEILHSLQPAADDSVDAMEKKLTQIKALHERGKAFNKLIVRYMERAKKIKRVACIEYVTANWAVCELLKKFQNQYYEVEKTIQKTYRKTFTENLRKYRRAAGLSQKELGALVQVSQRGMSNYELDDRDMPTYTLARISKVLGVSTDKLLGIT